MEVRDPSKKHYAQSHAGLIYLTLTMKEENRHLSSSIFSFQERSPN